MKRRRDDLYLDDLGYPSSLSICPVCGASVSKENIDLHVQQHFTHPQPSTSTTTNHCDLEGKFSFSFSSFDLNKKRQDFAKIFFRVFTIFWWHFSTCFLSFYFSFPVPGFSDAGDFKICTFGHCQQIGKSCLTSRFI